MCVGVGVLRVSNVFMCLVCDELCDVVWLALCCVCCSCVLVCVCLMGALFVVDCVVVYGLSSVCLRLCGVVCVRVCDVYCVMPCGLCVFCVALFLCVLVCV